MDKDKIREAQIRSLYTDERFEAIVLLYKNVMDKWGKESPKRDTEFETIYNLGIIEGKKMGLKEFFTILENS